MPLLPPEQTAVAALLFFRMTGLVWVAPLFSGRPLPWSLKVALLGLFSVLLFPVAASFAAEEVAVGPTTLVSELTVGLVLGLGAGLFVAAAESAGDLMAVQMGLSGANVVDPLSETQMPVLGQFMGLFVVTLLVSVGGHVLILGALARSLEAAPVGAVLGLGEGVFTLVRLGGELFLLGLRFAAPVVAAVMVANSGLGVMARTVPQLNVLMVAFPLQIAVGLFVLGAALPLMASFFSGWPARFDEITRILIDGLVPVDALRGGA